MIGMCGDLPCEICHVCSYPATWRGGPLMWMMLLHLHVNLNANDDDGGGGGGAILIIFVLANRLYSL